MDVDNIIIHVPQHEHCCKGVSDANVDSPKLLPVRRNVFNRSFHNGSFRCGKYSSRTQNGYASGTCFSFMRQISFDDLELLCRRDMAIGRNIVQRHADDATVDRWLVGEAKNDSRAAEQWREGHPRNATLFADTGETFRVNINVGLLVEPYPIKSFTLELCPNLLIRLETNDRNSSANVADLYRIDSIRDTPRKGSVNDRIFR